MSLEDILLMLPSGTNVEQLDYSFAIEYRGPPVDHPVPRAEPLDARLVGRRQRSPSSDRLSKLKPSPMELQKNTSENRILTMGTSPVTGLMDATTSPLSNLGAEKNTFSLRAGDDRNVLPIFTVLDSPGSSVSVSTTTSAMFMPSELISLSRKSSSSEIEELNIEFSATASAVASALSSPSNFRSASLNGNKQNSEAPALSDSAQRSMSLPVFERGENGSSPCGDGISSQQQQGQNQQRKKGNCYRCLKGHRLQEKEMCLVCSAKYCRNCVLIAMGSMPEGRKCLGCTGQSIHESSRIYLGKPSRLLKNLLCPLEIQQCMKTEKECPANQLRPQQLFVNGRALTVEEMSTLLGCNKPPSKLKPGRYWYDKSSGFWGKEGEKPCKIISPELKVGGDLKPDASNGTTQVFINGRQVTKSELKMLKLAGVQCPASTYLFLSPDGSYMEEGQNNVKGNIWSKASTRLMYSFFSLPTPRGNARLSKRALRDVSIRYLPVVEQKKVNRLLLLGHEGSGRSTIFKQAKFLFKEGFDAKEIEKYKDMIQSNLYKYLVTLLEGRERFEDESIEQMESDTQTRLPTTSGELISQQHKTVYSMDTRLKHLADWFLDIMADGSLDRYFPAATREYASSVEELWRDPAIQATYKRKDELHMLPDVAGEFLERAVDISSNEYEPADHDILYAEGLTQAGLAEIEFSLSDREQNSGQLHEAALDFASSSGRYQLIKVGGVGINEGKKWLGMFDDVKAVIFCVAISEYDQLWMDGNGLVRNKLIQSKELFQSIVSRPCFKNIPFVLLLNKYDKFEEKMMKGIPLTCCEWFSDFSPVGVAHSTQAQQAYTYVVHKFKKIVGDRKVYTFQLNALERGLVSSAFQYMKHVLKHEEESKSDTSNWALLPDDSSYTEDLSSYSQHQHHLHHQHQQHQHQLQLQQQHLHYSNSLERNGGFMCDEC